MLNKGLLLVALSAILWGISGGLGSFLMDKGWDPLVVSFYRGTVGLICLLIWFAFRPVRLNKRLCLWAVVAGIGIVGNFVFYFVSISESSVAVAAALMYTAPIFVLLISFIFHLEKPSLFKFIAIAFVMVGVVLLTEVYNVGSDQVTTIGLLAGLGAGLSYALFIFGFKYASKHGEPQGILAIAFLTFTFIMLFFTDLNEAVSVIYSPDWFWMILLGIFGAGLSFFLYVVGLEKTSPTSASVIAMVEPVTASSFGFFLLSETLNVVQLCGMAIILITVTVLSVKKG
ncbi:MULTISPECIES: DMT family transporter [Exiguobacterium]|uniref:DMT family transporter n=1 Tax=Exiguobacterium TaxID=33986 RepID=UPI000877591D|nr:MULTISPECIES: EamA family transporter [Exiguobacterium]TCI33115.1 EamA/RhaT family transporter [Exiguobacterium sp. SH4S7]TCI42235.1 EamA/RhaT family transporter [Exiguobacterium sp. SH5S32]TCI50147.1 EamA/RhaT family transporter [Exiguobacterium sp. SH1S4]TCI60444.1 EamA/RhaT family transporter [Exiguobacterium sp. SH0S2]TCI66991.1 EamA/RhaT family transporter [Exiguobacterium sp. SH1S1]